MNFSWAWNPGFGDSIGLPRRIFLVLLLFECHLPVLFWCAMSAYSWLRKCILCIWEASNWLIPWLFSLTGLRYWFYRRVSVPASYVILRFLIEGVLLPVVIYWTQWSYWDPEFSTASCLLSQWCSPHCFLHLVDECGWDFHVLVFWRNYVRCLVADMLILFLMVNVRINVNCGDAVLICPCWKLVAVSFFLISQLTDFLYPLWFQ